MVGVSGQNCLTTIHGLNQRIPKIWQKIKKRRANIIKKDSLINIFYTIYINKTIHHVLYHFVLMISDKTPSCKFPCPWRGKTFDLWEIGKSKSEVYAKFSKDGRRITWSFGITDECYQILDGFLVIR